MKAELRINFCNGVNKNEILFYFIYLFVHLLKLDKLLLNRIYCTNVVVIEIHILLQLGSFKYCISYNEFISIVASSNKCSEFHSTSFSIFLSKHKALYKHNFLEYAFQIKTLHQHLNYYEVITEFHGYYEKPKDNVQQQLVYYFYSVKTRNYYANINNM